MRHLNNTMLTASATLVMWATIIVVMVSSMTTTTTPAAATTTAATPNNTTTTTPSGIELSPEPVHQEQQTLVRIQLIRPTLSLHSLEMAL
jgi:hypothetical protein